MVSLCFMPCPVSGVPCHVRYRFPHLVFLSSQDSSLYHTPSPLPTNILLLSRSRFVASPVRHNQPLKPWQTKYASEELLRLASGFVYLIFWEKCDASSRSLNWLNSGAAKCLILFIKSIKSVRFSVRAPLSAKEYSHQRSTVPPFLAFLLRTP
jgi:hypothetical protein